MARRGTRLTIVQVAGDFREAAERLAAGGVETYRAQRYSVGYVEALAQRLDAVTTITCRTDEAYDVMLPSGARAIGAGFGGRVPERTIVKLVEKTDPDLLILRSPMRSLLLWSALKRRRTLALLADSFNDRSPKGRLTQIILKTLLNRPNVDVVANHGRRAARQLREIGVAADKIVAWDYPGLDTPHQRPAKARASEEGRILYVGVVSRPKGVGDLIDAVRLVQARGLKVTLEIIGRGDAAEIASLTEKAGSAPGVHFLGIKPNDEIVPRMVDADVVVVPSRHSYPEGLPLTIYEALCSRTPLVASDHPMFVENVEDGVSGLIFPAGDAAALADRIERLLNDASIYASLSHEGAAAWARLQIPVQWHELIDRWIDNGESLKRWIKDHAIAG